jgi:hypothetical protein
MKKKIMVLSILILFVATTVLPASGVMNELIEIENKKTTLYDTEVPTWEVGDSWTYACKFYSASDDDSLIFDISCDLTFEVVDVTGEFYILEGTSESISGIFSLMGLDLKITRFTTYSAEIKISKSDLGIIYHEYTIDGIFFPMVGSISLPIPFMITFTMDSDFNPEFLIAPFPLFEGKEGNVGTDVTQGFKLSLFKSITLVELTDTEFPLGPYHFVINEDQVTVEAGTFDVFNILFTGGADDYYFNYASEVGNFVSLKSEVTHVGGEKVYIDFKLELKSTNYER